MKTLKYVFIAACLGALALGCDSSINRNIFVQDGEKRASGLNTVNGTITVGSDCDIHGDCHTVNGGIRIGQNSTVRDLMAVNGSIDLGENVSSDDLQTINGPIETGAGSKVRGEVQSINGDIKLDGTQVEQDVSTYNGDITLRNKSIVKGDIVIKKSKGKHDHKRLVKIRIMDESVVEGDIMVLEPAMQVQVKVYLAKDARIKGKIENVEVIQEN
jgi:hypothetical protein